MFTRIVVPLDGSDVAEMALAPAVGLASSLNADLHLIRVTEIPHLNGAAMHGYMVDSRLLSEQIESEVELAREYLHENARVLADQGLNVTTQLESGFASTELVGAMKPGDLFVIASHGRSGVDRWYLGSVAEQVTRRATVPVMIFRSGQLISQDDQPATTATSSR